MFKIKKRYQCPISTLIKLRKKGKKYILVKTSFLTYVEEPKDNKLYKILAIKNFGTIKKGTVGGNIWGEHALSHQGDRWVEDGVTIEKEAKVLGNALVKKRFYCDREICDKG